MPTHAHTARSHGTRETHTPHGKAGWLGARCLQGQTLGLKQLVNRKAPHSLGLETWLLGLQAAHRLRGVAVSSSVGEEPL